MPYTPNTHTNITKNTTNNNTDSRTKTDSNTLPLSPFQFLPVPNILHSLDNDGGSNPTAPHPPRTLRLYLSISLTLSLYLSMHLYLHLSLHLFIP